MMKKIKGGRLPLFPSELESFASPSFPDISFSDIALRLLSKEREALLGRGFHEGETNPRWFFNVGEKSFVDFPPRLKSLLWDMHNHPGGRRVPSLLDAFSSRAMEPLELGIVDPWRRRLLQVYDRDRFSRFNEDWYIKHGLFSNPLYYGFPASLINPIRDVWLRKIFGHQIAIKDRPIAQHPLFSSWLEALKNRPIIEGDIA